MTRVERFEKLNKMMDVLNIKRGSCYEDYSNEVDCAATEEKCAKAFEDLLRFMEKEIKHEISNLDAYRLMEICEAYNA